MNLDFEKIKKRISEIEEAIIEIQKIISIDEDKFWIDKRNITSIKYYLIEAIESLGALCVHIIAKKLGKSSNSLGECFKLLKENNIISENLSLKLIKIAKFRNKLINRYWEIDDKLVYDYAKNELNDFKDFITEVKNYLSNELTF